MSATQRTLQFLRRRGLRADIAERWNAFSKPFGNRRDLFGWIDILAYSPDWGVIGVQSCTAGTRKEHKTRMLVDCREAVSTWLESRCVAELWVWRKLKVVRGGFKKVWSPLVSVFCLPGQDVSEHVRRLEEFFSGSRLKGWKVETVVLSEACLERDRPASL